MSALGQTRQFTVLCTTSAFPRTGDKIADMRQAVRCSDGQSILALPRHLDVYLLCNGESIIDLDAEIPDGALNLGVAE